MTHDSGAGSAGDGGPSRRELRAARRRAHEVEKQRRHQQSTGGKNDKKGKGSSGPDAAGQGRRR